MITASEALCLSTTPTLRLAESKIKMAACRGERQAVVYPANESGGTKLRDSLVYFGYCAELVTSPELVLKISW